MQALVRRALVGHRTARIAIRTPLGTSYCLQLRMGRADRSAHLGSRRILYWRLDLKVMRRILAFIVGYLAHRSASTFSSAPSFLFTMVLMALKSEPGEAWYILLQLKTMMQVPRHCRKVMPDAGPRVRLVQSLNFLTTVFSHAYLTTLIYMLPFCILGNRAARSPWRISLNCMLILGLYPLCNYLVADYLLGFFWKVVDHGINGHGRLYPPLTRHVELGIGA